MGSISLSLATTTYHNMIHFCIKNIEHELVPLSTWSVSPHDLPSWKLYSPCTLCIYTKCTPVQCIYTQLQLLDHLPYGNVQVIMCWVEANYHAWAGGLHWWLFVLFWPCCFTGWALSSQGDVTEQLKSTIAVELISVSGCWQASGRAYARCDYPSWCNKFRF